MTSPPFQAKNDPRKQFMVTEVDPRIHFTLNCGAESCPPIGVYHGDKLESELKRATNGFLN
jgi:hypothetical protein